MEPRFGHDFSNVRVHSDSKAAESARAVGALAYTVGRHVVFGGEPSMSGNDGLLAHELTHVMQQRGAEAPAGNIEVGPSHDSFESMADANETGVARHGAAGIARLPAVRVQRASFGSDLLGFFSAPLRLFGVENYADDELLDYFDKYASQGKVEDSYDSDNKARAIVKRWKGGRLTFQANGKSRSLTLDKKAKVALAMEMFRGHRSGDDVNQTLSLLQGSTDDEIEAIVAWVGEDELNTEETTCKFVTEWNNPGSKRKCPRDRPKEPSPKDKPDRATPYTGKPYPGSATDALSAFLATELGQKVKAAALDRLKRDWDKTSLGEKITIIAEALLMVGAATYGIAKMSSNQQKGVLDLIIGDDDTMLQKPLDTKTLFEPKFDF
jgi:hypothetical protein